LTTNLAAEATARTAADNTLTTNLAAEATARTAADTAIRTDFAAADTTERNARTAADTALQGEIDAEEATRAALIRTEGNNIDGNPIIHIGENSLVTQELGGEQLLSATDGVNDIDIRISGDTNLIVDNNLTVTGATTTNGINNSGQKITGLANGTIAADAATFGQMQTADNALGLRIDNEISARIAGDNTVRTEFAAADNLIRTQFAAADTALGTAVRNEFAAADTTERNARIAGDERLQTNIDENTRGIAMVAAMTNTTVDTGKTHGVDFNMAQFQSETGFAFGYANRINENVQVHTSVASTTDFDESVVRLGVAVQW
jgi:hypothetical protein